MDDKDKPKLAVTNDDYVDDVFIIKRIPRIKKFCYFFSLKYGIYCVIVLSILVGVGSFAGFFVLSDRPEVNYPTVLLLLLMTIYGVTSVMFIIVTIVLLIAVLVKNFTLMPYYLWLTIMFWTIQFFLGVVIPLLLIFEEQYPTALGLTWSCVVIFLGLLWTHFLATVKSYMLVLRNEVCENVRTVLEPRE